LPINTDYRSMLRNMRKEYCKKGMPTTKEKFSDGSVMVVCKRARAVFYATMRKNKWDETKPRPSATEETLRWFIKSKGIDVDNKK